MLFGKAISNKNIPFLNFFHEFMCSSDTFEIINQNIILVQYSMVDLTKEAHLYDVGFKDI